MSVIAAVAAIAIIATVLKLGKGGSNPTVVAPTNAEQTAQIQQTTEKNSTSTTSQIRNIVRTTQRPPSGQTPVIAGATNPTTAKSMPLVADWDDKINDILGPEGEEKEKSKKLIELFPQLPPDGQEEVAHHLSNLVADEDYAPLANFVTNSALPEAVLDVFVEDVFNRPNAVKLPLLLDIAQDPQHPRASEAKDVLELFLEEDFGNDWTKWHAKMDQWLKDNPD